MLVNILQTFDDANGKRRYAGENPDVDPAIARKWVQDGNAAYDADTKQDRPILSQVAAAILRPANIAAVKPPSAAIGLSAITATNTWRQVFQLPTPGKVLVRAVYETDNATPAARTASFAASDTFGYAATIGGAAQTWQVAGALTPSAPGTITTIADWSVARTGWYLLDVPAAVDSGVGGYVMVNTKFAASDKCLAGSAGPRPFTEYVSYINPKLPTGKYASFYAAGDFASVNQNSFVAAVPEGGQFAPCYLEYIPLNSVFYGVAIGNSTTAGMGLGDPTAQPNNYGWPLIAANARVAAGAPVVISNFAHEGATAADYLGAPTTTGRLSLLFKSADFKPSFVVIQPTASSGGLDAGTIETTLTNLLLWCKLLREYGILPIVRTMFPTNGLSAPREAVRQQLNNQIRASGEVVFDIDAIVRDPSNQATILPSLTVDGTHLNIAGNELAALDPTRGFARLLSRIGA